MNPFEVIMFILGFGSILFLAYITTRYVAGKSNIAMKGKHLSIIETLNLGIDKKIHLVKAGEQYILISSSAKSVEFLTTLSLNEDDTSVEISNSNNTNTFDFKGLFEKYINTYKSKKGVIVRQEHDITGHSNEEDNFKFNLHKLRNITQKINTKVEKDGVDFTNEE